METIATKKDEVNDDLGDDDEDGRESNQEDDDGEAHYGEELLQSNIGHEMLVAQRCKHMRRRRRGRRWCQ